MLPLKSKDFLNCLNLDKKKPTPTLVSNETRIIGWAVQNKMHATEWYSFRPHHEREIYLDYNFEGKLQINI